MCPVSGTGDKIAKKVHTLEETGIHEFINKYNMMSGNEAIILPVLFRKRECGWRCCFPGKASLLQCHLNKDLNDWRGGGFWCPRQIEWARSCWSQFSLICNSTSQGSCARKVE